MTHRMTTAMVMIGLAAGGADGAGAGAGRRGPGSPGRRDASSDTNVPEPVRASA